MRLDKYLSDAGVGSRADVKDMIRKGRIRVNGAAVKKPETVVMTGDTVEADGQPVTREDFEYYLLYKPKGYLTAVSDSRKPVVMDLVPSKRKDLSPAGRLDEDTEGALLITNDGALIHYLISPKSGVVKRYYAELASKLPEDAAERLAKPVEFKEFTSSPAVLEKLTETSACLSVTEGKYHEVKRLFHHIGCDVTYLRRESFGGLTLDGLRPGELRPLTASEIEKLKRPVSGIGVEKDET